jgi:uncharacterized hydrophobic protein (TIGR00271 family)
MRLWDRVLPAAQRRPLDGLKDHLDLAAGDRRSKASAFWTMLILSGFIAVAGVLADSTATVIGAMIIAPLSVPIMGIALGIVLADARLVSRSLGIVTVGVAVVVAIGFLCSILLPSTVNLLTNGQVTSRTSPNVLDLIAAVATGLAGAVGLSRKDVSDVLPGVAIAISLVPPLGVVGVCLGQGEVAMALGALVLFLSNVVALVLAGTVVFTSYGYRRDEAPSPGFRKRRAYAAVGVGVVLVLVPLAANSVFTWQVAVWTERVQSAAATWIAPSDGRVTGVSVVSSKAVVSVVLPGTLPDATPLVDSLDGQVPNGVTIVVDAGVGEQVEAGVVGSSSS